MHLIVSCPIPFLIPACIISSMIGCISSTILRPITRRILSALPYVYPHKDCAICIICSWYRITPSVSFSIGSSLGCKYVTFSRPCLLASKVLSIPASSTPGLPIATVSIRSSTLLVLIACTISVMVFDSIWKQPSVYPALNMSPVFLSFMSMLERLISSGIRLRVFWIISNASSPSISSFMIPCFSSK